MDNVKPYILITGGCGYLGSNLIKKLQYNYNIIVLERNIKKESVNIHSNKIVFFDIQKTSPDSIFKKFLVEIIIHTATIYGRKGEEVDEIFEFNTYFMLKLLRDAIENKVLYFINTDTVLNKYVNPYALSKSQFKEWLNFYAIQKKIHVINLQLEHFYGPSTGDNNFITLMIKKMLINEKSIALTKGEQKRDFIYIDDLLSVYNHILRLRESFSYFENIDVCSGNTIKLKDIIKLIHKYTNSVSELKFGEIPYRENELMESSSNPAKLLNMGWEPKTDLETGLKSIINYEKKDYESRHY